MQKLFSLDGKMVRILTFDRFNYFKYSIYCELYSNSYNWGITNFSYDNVVSYFKR